MKPTRTLAIISPKGERVATTTDSPEYLKAAAEMVRAMGYDLADCRLERSIPPPKQPVHVEYHPKPRKKRSK